MSILFKSVKILLPLLASAAIFPASASSFSSVTLGAASNLTVFNMGPTQFSASNSGTTFQGNAGLASGASTNFSGGGTLTGTLYKDPGATVQSNLAAQFNVNGGVQTSSLSQAVSDVQAASQNAANLSATETFSGDLTNGHTFSSIGQFNVLDIMGNVTVTNPSKNIVLSGGSNDYFIVNVDGSLSVSNGSIGLTGGLTPNHILFNVLGGDISLSNASSSLFGTYLDVNHRINLTPGTVTGAVMGNQIHTSSGPNVISGIYVTPVPLPGAYLMFLTCVGVLGAIRSKKQRNMLVA
jgi:hypothetical protein